MSDKTKGKLRIKFLEKLMLHAADKETFEFFLTSFDTVLDEAKAELPNRDMFTPALEYWFKKWFGKP